MDVFMTSATGYVGRAVALHLTGRGHRVAALVRSPASAGEAERMGVRPVPGRLDDPATYTAEVRAAHAVVHTAFEYRADGSENAALDTAATHALLAAARSGETRHFIYTSNGYLPQVTDERLVETHELEPAAQPERAWRLGVERDVVAAAHADLHTAVLRLGMVYGGRGGGTLVDLFEAAARAKVLPYLAAACRNRWSLIHLGDLASLYASVLEQGGRGVFHAVDDHPITAEAVVAAAAACCGVEAVQQDEPQVRAVLDAHTIDLMQRDVALHARASLGLGWSPRFRDLPAGIASAHADWRQGAAA